MHRPIPRDDATATATAAASPPPPPPPPVAPPQAAPPSATIDLREPLAPWHDPNPAPPVEAPAATEPWRDTALPPRRAAAITLPLWQGSAAVPSAMVRERPPAPGAARPSGTAEAAGTDAELVSTRQPTKDRCPHCGGKVRLDRFDLVEAVAQMSCTDCGFRYQAKSPKL